MRGVLAGLVLALAPGVAAAQGVTTPHGGAEPAADPPTATYRVFVGAESADVLHRIRFGPEGASIERTITMGDLYEKSGMPELYSESEAPHGVAVSPREDAVYMTTGHGLPEGKLWKVDGRTGGLLADPLPLGRFPASLGVSPDGNYVLVANFNLHGEMTPSSISVVFGPQMIELERIVTCTMPHGSRFHPDGRRHFSVCMMDDQLVEIDLTGMGVSRRLLLTPGEEGPLDPSDRGFHDPRGPHAGHGMHFEAGCSPTWVQPSHDGSRIYVACNRSDQVLEVDFEEWTVVRRFATGRGPYNVDVTPDDRTLVVTLKQGDGVQFIDLESGETLAIADTSTRVVHGVALSPDSRYAFISVEGIGAEPGRVDIFDLRSFRRVDSVAVGQQASGIAFWSMEGG